MRKRSFAHPFVAALLFVAMICQGTGVLAGTTGGLSGAVLDEKGAPVGDAAVSVASPTGVARTATDATGHFTFLALSPDTYVVSVEKTGYEATSVAGVTVFADQVASVQIEQRHALRQIGQVTARAATSLIKPGTVTDVYSVSPEQQAKIQGVGGGGNLNTAWSAIATVPGVFVLPGQAGYIGAAPTLSIRGGDYNQIGYEVDGVPVNRAFDNYPSGPASSLGQQELQVYTGVPPANAEASGLSGFINQVIRTGTYPGFADADLGLGGGAFYHKTAFEIGGSTPNRNITYYLGIGGYNQDFRTIDNSNGAGYTNTFGTPITFCAPGVGSPSSTPSCFYNGQYAGNNLTGLGFTGCNACGAYVLGGPELFALSSLVDRDNVANVHFALPHKNGLKDDIQLLGMVNYIENKFYTSTNDQGGAAFLGSDTTLGVPYFVDGYVVNTVTGTALPSNYQSLAGRYSFPDQPAHQFFGAIPSAERDGFVNDQAIYKLQYTHNMGTNALFKIYGYTYYSDWMNNSPEGAFANYFACCNPDYELSSHTRGVSGSLIDQIDPANLLNFTASYTTATTTRDNNTTMINGLYPQVFGLPNFINTRTGFAVLVNAKSPTAGVCYGTDGNGGTFATTCHESGEGPSTGTNGFPTSTGGGAAYASLYEAYSGSIPSVSGLTCGNGPCEWYVIGNGQYATYNQVKPKFTAASLTDQFKPSARLTINAGIRFDQFQYDGSDTSGSGARSLFYNAFNADTCQDGAHNLYDKVLNLGGSIAQPCSAFGLSPIAVTNPSGVVTQTYSEFQPRLGATYSLDPFTVLRASYGRYAQGPNSAFVQYDALQQNTPALLYNTYSFQKFGFTSPDHPVRPEISNNVDFSIEHQFKGDMSLKLTPFYRTTQDQIQQFFLNQQTGFVSGLNVGQQTSRGVEFEVDKGDFARQGLAARLTFAYTNSYIKYTALANGSSVITPLNDAIGQYNAYTSACGPGGKDVGKTQYGQPICGAPTGSYATYTGKAAAPCYDSSGDPEYSCTAADVANPYWNAPVQGFLDPNGNYPTFDILPQGIGSSYNAFGAPYVATLLLNEHVGRFSITPVLQMFAGQRYGAPSTTLGIAPDTCTGVLASGIAGDPRYPYGAPGGSPYDATGQVSGTGCATLAGGIPNVDTGNFDGIGAFVAPTQLQGHLQFSYDASRNVTLVANLTNLLNRCFGGSQVKWSVYNACGYTTLAGGTTGGVGNTYNPGSAIMPYVNRPYAPFFQASPFSFFLNAKIKL